MSRSEGVVSTHEVPEEEWEEGRFGGRQQDLGRAAGSVALGLRRTVIAPGKQFSPRHAHMAEEEIFVVLRGQGTLLRGKERVAVEAGDVAVFPAGTGVAHAFVADSREELEFLSIAWGACKKRTTSTANSSEPGWPSGRHHLCDHLARLIHPSAWKGSSRRSTRRLLVSG